MSSEGCSLEIAFIHKELLNNCGGRALVGLEGIVD